MRAPPREHEDLRKAARQVDTNHCKGIRANGICVPLGREQPRSRLVCPDAHMMTMSPLSFLPRACIW